MGNWQLISEHRRTVEGLLQTTWRFLLLGGIALGFALMFLLPWLLHNDDAFSGSNDKEQKVMIIASLVSLLIAGGLLAVVPWRWLGRAAVVRLFQEGVQWRQGGHEHERRWEDVREVYRMELHIRQYDTDPSDWNRHSDLRLVFTDGEQVRFNHILSDYSRLAEYVQQATAERLLPAARAALTASGIAFGSLQLGREGLMLGRDVFPWETLTMIWVSYGDLGWHAARGLTGSVALKDIPNYAVVLRLMGEKTALNAWIIGSDDDLGLLDRPYDLALGLASPRPKTWGNPHVETRSQPGSEGAGRQ